MSELSLSMLLKATPMGFLIYRYDDVEDPRSMRIVLVNQAAEEASRTEFAHLEGELLADHFPELMDSAIPEIFHQVMKTGTAASLPIRYEGGEKVPMGVFDTHVFRLGDRHLAALYNDVTARVVAEEELSRRVAEVHELNEALKLHEARSRRRAEQTEARLSSLVQSSTQAILSLDENALIVDWNAAAERLFGFAQDEIVGQPVTLLVGSGQQDQIRAKLALLRDDQRIAPFELVALGKDNQHIDVLVSASSIVVNREVVGMSAIMIDLSERKRLEEQMRAAQRMEAVGRLAGGVAHDFNNVLTAIFSFTNFALDGMHTEEPGYSDLQQVIEAARRAQDLTRQLLAFSRKRIVAPRVVNITKHVAGMDRMLRRILGEDIDFQTHLAIDLWNARVDRSGLEQVIVNLAVNARDAMPHGGRLTIETANETLGSDYGAERGVVVPPGQYVCVAVTDSGIGMDVETQRHIFEPFFTTKSEGSGTGLGLATCYGIVKQAGGYVWVYSELGQGTTFKVYLPRVTEREDVIDRDDRTAPAKGTEAILIAEDDPHVRRVAVRTLSRLGYTVLEAENGAEALLVADEAQHPIDLLLTDVVMPRMSGKSLAKRLTRQLPSMKVLFMSGYTNDAIVHHGVLEPEIEFIHKPFLPDDLARRVRHVLDTSTPPVRVAPRVLLIDDNAMLLRTLQRSLGQDYDITLATGGVAALELLRKEDYDLVLADVLMPDMTGLDLYEAVRRERPEMADGFVFMTAADQEKVASFIVTTDRPVVPKSELSGNLRGIVGGALNDKSSRAL